MREVSLHRKPNGSYKSTAKYSVKCGIRDVQVIKRSVKGMSELWNDNVKKSKHPPRPEWHEAIDVHRNFTNDERLTGVSFG